MNNSNIITVEPGKRGGQPTIRGMRIAVKDILKMIDSGMTEHQIFEDFPELTKVHIMAAVAHHQYSTGKLKGFRNTGNLMNFLRKS